MAKRFVGMLLDVAQPRISRGSIKFSKMELMDEAGASVTWTDMSMERELADGLRTQTKCTFYFSKTWSTVYGVRAEGTEGRFSASSANILMLIMSIGMIFGGVSTSMFLFPILVALAGLAGMFMCLDARHARSLFRKDAKAARSTAAAVVSA